MNDQELKRAATVKDLGMDPLMEKSFKQLMKDIPKRIAALVTKALGKEMSLRIAGLWIATDLVIKGVISDYVWAVAFLAFLFGYPIIGVIKDIKR